jgi:hypothetical protein
MGEINRLLQEQLKATEASLNEQQRLLQEQQRLLQEQQQAEERRRTQERLEAERRLRKEERQKEIAKIEVALSPENEAVRKSVRLIIFAPVLEGLFYLLAKLFEWVINGNPTGHGAPAFLLNAAGKTIGFLGIMVFGLACWAGVVIAPIVVVYALVKLLGSLGKASALKRKIELLESMD